MPRTTTAAMRTHLESEATHIFWMGFFDFLGQGHAQYLHTDIGNIQWNSQTWRGTGTLGDVAPVGEDSTLNPNEYQVRLSGIGNNLINEARGGDHIGRDAELYLAARDLATGNLIGDPILVLSGKMDRMDVVVSAASSVITLHLQDDRVLLEQSPGIWLTHEQQQERSAGDSILKFAAGLSNKRIQWGPGAEVVSNRSPGRDPTPPRRPPTIPDIEPRPQIP